MSNYSYLEAQKIVQGQGIKSATEYRSLYSTLGLPSNPNRTYKDTGWISWDDFFDKKEVPTYVEAKNVVLKKGIKSYQEYKAIWKELGLPSHPQRTYKDTGWINWNSFFGKKEVPTYVEAKKIVLKKGIKSYQEYRTICKEYALPLVPEEYYKGRGWKGWRDFFGKEIKEYPTYEEAKKIVQLRGIKTMDVYRATYKGIVYKNFVFPADPASYYKGKGWIDCASFFGSPKRITFNERKYRILTKLSLSPILLQEDAPLQVIYILASELDRKLAKEMEELLVITTFEERLHWVKEQLKKLKEGCTTISKTMDITPSDELSAMESILEEFEVTDKISFTLENYLHSAINRELISEYDD